MSAETYGLGEGNFDERLDFGHGNGDVILQRFRIATSLLGGTGTVELTDDYVTDDVESSLLHIVDEMNERRGVDAARIIDEKEHLRSPELDVLATRIQ